MGKRKGTKAGRGRNGDRYRCGKCGAEVIVTKACAYRARGPVCCGEAMVLWNRGSALDFV